MPPPYNGTFDKQKMEGFFDAMKQPGSVGFGLWALLRNFMADIMRIMEKRGEMVRRVEKGKEIF